MDDELNIEDTPPQNQFSITNSGKDSISFKVNGEEINLIKPGSCFGYYIESGMIITIDHVEE